MITCLDLSYFIGLEFWGAVVVNETNSSHELVKKEGMVRAKG